MEAHVAVGVEETYGLDGTGWRGQFIQQLVEQLAFRTGWQELTQRQMALELS